MLLIGTTGTETRFLSEAELPDCARLAYGTEGREDMRPEEIADRELAEALQRSIQESGKKRSSICALQPVVGGLFFTSVKFTIACATSSFFVSMPFIQTSDIGSCIITSCHHLRNFAML